MHINLAYPLLIFSPEFLLSRHLYKSGIAYSSFIIQQPPPHRHNPNRLSPSTIISSSSLVIIHRSSTATFSASFSKAFTSRFRVSGSLNYMILVWPYALHPDKSLLLYSDDRNINHRHTVFFNVTATRFSNKEVSGSIKNRLSIPLSIK